MTLTGNDSPSDAERCALALGAWYLILIVFNQYIVYALIGRQHLSPPRSQK
jgi:hypothetical protein